MIPKTTPPVKVAQFTVFEYDDDPGYDDPDHPWVLIVHVLVEGSDDAELEVGCYATPGQAFDAAHKWAKQRSFELSILSYDWEVIKPGKVVL